MFSRTQAPDQLDAYECTGDQAIVLAEPYVAESGALKRERGTAAAPIYAPTSSCRRSSCPAVQRNRSKQSSRRPSRSRHSSEPGRLAMLEKRWARRY
jgi:hypothetical protein